MNLQAEEAVGQRDEEGPSVFTANPRSLYERTADPRIDEQTRIRRHLLAVEMQLRDFSPPWLSAQQQTRREKMLDVLADYREQGVFPANTVYADGPRPVFIDEENVHCAVGYLIKESGHAELASKVRDRDNLIYIPHLKDEAFIGWTQEHGLTPTECAYIQPSYEFMGRRPPSAPPTSPVNPAPTPSKPSKPPAPPSSSGDYPPWVHHRPGDHSSQGWCLDSQNFSSSSNDEDRLMRVEAPSAPPRTPTPTPESTPIATPRESAPTGFLHAASA